MRYCNKYSINTKNIKYSSHLSTYILKLVLSITASGPRESSYGCYCGYQSGQYRTCLGDVFSVTWMEDLDEVRILIIHYLNLTKLHHL